MSTTIVKKDTIKKRCEAIMLKIDTSRAEAAIALAKQDLWWRLLFNKFLPAKYKKTEKEIIKLKAIEKSHDVIVLTICAKQYNIMNKLLSLIELSTYECITISSDDAYYLE